MKGIAVLLCSVLLFPFQAFSAVENITPPSSKTAENKVPLHRQKRVQVTSGDETSKAKKTKKKKVDATSDSQRIKVVNVAGDTMTVVANDSISKLLNAEILTRRDSLHKDSVERAYYGKVKIFNPDPNRAMWLSAVLPGLGQVYNRRYWKLPLIIGGYVGLGYATSWNNRMLTDYTKAYSDAMDNDPNTKSYMDFYPPTTKESDIDMAWLKKSLKAKKDYYRRNRDLCIISMVGLYMLCMVDAYVDASLAHFDISQDLSMRVKPAFINPGINRLPGVGLQCALNF